MLFTLSGDVRRHGVFELPLGVTLRELIEDLGGGVNEGRRLKARLTSVHLQSDLPQDGQAAEGDTQAVRREHRRWAGIGQRHSLAVCRARRLAFMTAR
jgi:NADH:ubiquinone oxidoreductase subunit F (NADH-binding)